MSETVSTLASGMPGVQIVAGVLGMVIPAALLRGGVRALARML